MAMPTLMDIATRNAADLTIELLDEAVQYAPEVDLGPARTIRGRQYKTLVRTANPTVSFRDANEGSAISKGTYENRLVETFIFNPQWEADKAVAQSSEDGADAYLADEAQAIVNASLFHLGKVFYYGKDATFGDAKGFPGLLASYDSTNMEVSAGGTTDSINSSVWAVVWGPQHCRWVWGLDGSLDLSDVTEVRLIDGSSNPYTGLRQELLAYAGMQIRSKYSCARIKLINSTDSGKNLSDALIYQLLGKFPAGIEPDVLLMTRRSLEGLRASRTATNPTGAPAPYPEYIQGVTKRIPIQITEAITNTETLTL